MPGSLSDLHALPVFRDLPAEQREALLGSAIQHSVAAGTVLFEQGEMPTFQIVLVSGSLQLFSRADEGREVLMEVVHAPDLIIPAAVVTGAPYLMQARVPEASRFLLIQATAFRDAVAEDPRLAHAVIESLALQFRRMVRQIKNLKLRSSVERVGCYILALSRRQGSPGEAVLPYEKSLVASELGITRESFSRALSSFDRAGIIRVEGPRILVLDEARVIAQCKPDPLIDGET